MGANKSSKGWIWYLLVLVIAGLVALGLVFSIRKKSHRHSGDSPLSVPESPGAVSKKYADALGTALQFFDVQKSGKLKNNNIAWRGDSALKDGSEAHLDLSKGMYDAGDHVKFGFPMAFTATVLSWAVLEYGDQMDKVSQLESAKGSLKWITDYLIECHPSANVLYIQVGDPNIDHKCWERPETMSEKRPLTQVNKTSPGTEVAAETAAALAAASLVFRNTDSDYSKTLISHSKDLFKFADTYKGSYSISIPQVQDYYNSTGFNDELLWAATWLYHATGDHAYLNYVVDNSATSPGSPTWFCWDNKFAGVQVLLSRLTFFSSNKIKSEVNNGIQMYVKTAEAVICGFLPDSPTATESRSGGGLIWVSDWNSLQHPVASAFLAVLYSDYMLTSQTSKLQCSGKSFSSWDLRKFAISQADYILGNNPMKLSYLVGYGDNYPQYVHHRGASIPADAGTGCEGFQYLTSTQPNPNIAFGALVGGPFKNDSFIDARNNSMQAEPSTYNSALLVGLLSGLVTTSTVLQSFA